ncbi:hypothetical protein DRQ09_00975, partial [candidate division KSB1 bacterium]
MIFSQTLPLKNYNTKDGLPQSTIRCIFQDSKGFIWFGTFNGISKFNGTKFYNYNIENGLSNNTVNSIMEDNNGNIWIGTPKGLNKMVNSKITVEKLKGNITKILKDKKGNLFILIPKQTIYKYDGKEFTPLDFNFNKKELHITNFALDKKDNIILINSGKLYRYDFVSTKEI